MYQKFDTEFRKNSAASKIFEELEDEIWAQLHSLEYFKMMGNRSGMVYPSGAAVSH